MEEKIQQYLNDAFAGEDDVILTSLHGNFFNYKRGDGWGTGTVSDTGEIELTS